MRYLLLFLFSLSLISVRAQTKKDDSKDDCLVVVGSFNNKKKVDDIWAYLYQDNTRIDSMKISSKKGFQFILKTGKNYAILVSKGGYYNRMIRLSTILPAGVIPKPVFLFGFKTEMIPVKISVDDYWLDFPVAQVIYDSILKDFGYNKKYTKTIREELEKLDLLKYSKGK